MKLFIDYLLDRTGSVAAWIGFILAILEILLHLGNVSTLMLVFAVVLIVTPEEKIQKQLRVWTDKLKEAAK